MFLAQKDQKAQFSGIQMRCAGLTNFRLSSINEPMPLMPI